MLVGLVMGAASFAGTLYWIPDVLVTFGGLSRVLAIPVAGLLVAYLALFPALASWLIARAMATYGATGVWIAPFAWVASEWMRGWFLSGFPWALLGTSQVPWLAVAQSASLFGVWGLSAWIVAVNVAITCAVSKRAWLAHAPAGVALLTVALVVWGASRLGADATRSGAPVLRVGVVQGNVPQEQKWSPEAAEEIYARYLRLSRDAAGAGARFIVWPESATPFFLEEDPVRAEPLRAVARDAGAWLLVGSDQIERGPSPRYYNAAFLIDPQGRTAGVYRKQRLVPFGEYVPLRSVLFFVAPLVEAVSDFSPGEKGAMLAFDGGPFNTAICYEVVFGEISRAAVARGSRLLTTITNDAWYGHSSAPWQHFDQAALRAIELDRYLVRAANTGISGVVDPRGRTVSRLGLFEEGTLVADVRLLDTRTLYSRIGDSFAWASVALSLLALVRSGRAGRAA